MTCKDCIHYDVCQYHVDEETTMTINECSHEFKHKDRYAPAYIGQPVWYVSSIRKYENRDFIVTGYEILEGKVSMLQQKVDKSWKIRVTQGSFVSDYTTDEYNEHFFSTLSAAETELSKKLSELAVETEKVSNDWLY